MPQTTEEAYPDAIDAIVSTAREENIPAYTDREAAATMFERRLRAHHTVSHALRSCVGSIRTERRSLNAQAERDATAAFNKRNRDTAIARDTLNRVRERQALRMRRDSRAPLQRLADGLLRANRLGGQRALTVDPNGGGRSAEQTRIGPPNAERASYDRTVRILTALIVALERELDDVEYGAIPEDSPSRAKRIANDYAGLPAEIVAFIDASAGTAASIRRDRVSRGLDPRTGRAPARRPDDQRTDA